MRLACPTPEAGSQRFSEFAHEFHSVEIGLGPGGLRLMCVSELMARLLRAPPPIHSEAAPRTVGALRRRQA
jgi:hypothetical protein